MAIGKRKGKAVKGAGQTGSSGSDAVGGSLSKSDHYYLQQAWGLVGDPGGTEATVGTPTGMTASGGVIGEYLHPGGTVYRYHVFNGSNNWIVSALAPPTLIG